MIDYTKLRKKLIPEPDGQDTLVLRVGTISAIDAATGSTTVTLVDGAVVPAVPVLGSARFAVGTVVQILSYRGSLLVIGGAASKGSQPAELTTVSAGNGTTTATGFTNVLTVTAPVLSSFGVPFIAPPSGKVAVFGRSLGAHSVINGFSHLDFEVKTGTVIGSGSSVRGPDDLTTSVFQSNPAGQQGNLNVFGLVTGLTPGAQYHADLVYKLTTAGTGTYNRRHVMVLPQ